MEVWHRIVCGFLLLCVAVTAAYAENPEESTLEMMTVTARKQEENVQEVPMSISVFGQQEIEDGMIDSVVKIADFVPSLTIFDNGASGMYSPSTRGIHAFVESLTVSTGLFVDGIPVLSPTGFEDALVDIERIEVLRGPQVSPGRSALH